MLINFRVRRSLSLIFSILVILSLAVPAHAAGSKPYQAASAIKGASSSGLRDGQAAREQIAMLAEDTELSVTIFSSPYATLDHNDPYGYNGETPHVFAVEAAVTNIGQATALDLLVSLSYYADPVNGWALLTGEDPDRTIDSLAPGATYYAYWLVRYSSVIGAYHFYSITASATNAPPVTVSDNYYGNPIPGYPIQTSPVVSTGNSGVSQISADVIVGTTITLTVTYDLGTNPKHVTFSPVGNTDFEPSAYRLVTTQVRVYNDLGTQQQITTDRLYFPTLPAFAQNAEVSYIFLVLTPERMRLCSYGWVGYNSTDKYDQFYCDALTTIWVDATLSVDMQKTASSSVLLQGDTIDYTIDYANTGTNAVSFAWIWDDVAESLGNVITPTIAPPPDWDETSGSLVAWYLGTLPPAGQPGSSGSLTFSFLVDGNGQDIPDMTGLVNRAFLGINPGSLPAHAALTDTVVTTISAPDITISKTDNHDSAEIGETLTYDLVVANGGSSAAAQVLITDTLPADVVYLSANPAPDIQDGQTLVWNSLGSIPSGGQVSIAINTQVADYTPNGTVLANWAYIQYENLLGYEYAVKSASDETTVVAPEFTISKSDYPDPVLSGYWITYTLAYENVGDLAATNAQIIDTIPLSTTFYSCSGCNLNGNIATWDLGEVLPGGSGSFSLVVQVDENLASGTIIANSDYGIQSDQTSFLAGEPVYTNVVKEPCHVTGHAFVDMDGDGYFDSSEAGLPGVAITLPVATEPTDTTGSDGSYQFVVMYDVSTTISASLPPGFFRTTPGIINFQTQLDITQTINFGYAPVDIPVGIIYGTVYDDLNHNGVYEVGESGVPGVSISSAEAITSPVTTNEWGAYTLDFAASGLVTITETNLPAYLSTTPDVIPTYAESGSSGPSPVDFGDFGGVVISGMVFDDLNVNGTNDSEPGIEGVQVIAGGDSHLSASDGSFTLYVKPDAENPITIHETDLPGYLSTNAIPGDGMVRVDVNILQIIDPVSGTVYAGAEFGDVLSTNAITITGEVWNDNGAGGGGLANGIPDGTEPGLGGATLLLSSGMSAITGEDGLFSLYAPAGQEVTLTEMNPPGFVSTNAIPGNNAHAVDVDTLVIESATSSGNLFGDVEANSVAFIQGFVYHDLNENGLMDGDEAGIRDVQVSMGFPDGEAIVTRTGDDGSYEFAVSPGSMIMITSAIPTGFHPTSPTTLFITPPDPGYYTGANFGFSNSQTTAVIFGIVFEDINSNGQQDFGEFGLGGAVLTLDATFTQTTTGDGPLAGTYTFVVDSTGNHILDETNPAGYRSTTPDSLNIPVTEFGQSYYTEFGDTALPTTATIFGIVFDDLDSDGMQDSNEPGLPGVVISVTVSGGVITTTTKLYGQYTYGFEVEEAGYHLVSEQDPALPGYHSTTPDDVILFVELGESYIVNFGDTQTSNSTLLGVVFNDTSGDGIQDPAELGIPGVLIALSNGMTTTTGQYGEYLFSLSITGTYLVVETDPPGYHSTTPNEVAVAVPDLGTDYVVNFGDSLNPLLSSIFGTVFNDANGNGAHDVNEQGIPGVLIELQNENPLQTTTNEWGQWTFQVEVTGEFTITETDLSGWDSTCALPGSQWVTKIDNNTMLASVETLGVDLGDNQFGDWISTQPTWLIFYLPVILRP